MFGWVKRWWTWLMTEGDEAVEEVRQTTVTVCGFLPTVQTVVNILALGNPALTAPLAIAQAICMALKAHNSVVKLFKDDTVKPVVQGVEIEGEYVGQELL
jgi:hypothetical protein